MASFTKRGKRWLAQVRRNGVPPQSRSFSALSEAKAWAAGVEADIDGGLSLPPRRLFCATNVGDLIDRYLREITPTKRSADTERPRLLQIGRDPVASISLLNFTPKAAAQYRDRRLGVVAASTVRRELALLSHVAEIARREWGFTTLCNPVKGIRQPPPGSARTRRFRRDESQRLFAAISATRNPEVEPIVRLAIETGMRRGEILSLDWEHIDLARRLAHIPITKTGSPRTIALTDGAVSLLQSRQAAPSGRVFTISPNAFRLAWVRAVRRSGIADLRFHDLRHEAVSRFFEMGLSMPEVASISGHRDPRMLSRYTHLSPDGLAHKLRNLRWAASVAQFNPSK